MTTTATRRPTSDEKTPSTGAFTVAHRDLVDALKTLALPATGRKQLPVFSRALATVRPDQVELTTFDFDVAATVTLPATGTTTGRMLLDHPSLTKVLSAAVKGTTKATSRSPPPTTPRSCTSAATACLWTTPSPSTPSPTSH